MDSTVYNESADLIEVDRKIVGLATAKPGIAAADAVRQLLGRWTGPYLRARIDLLDARGDLHVDRRDHRVFLYPVAKVDE